MRTKYMLRHEHVEHDRAIDSCPVCDANRWTIYAPIENARYGDYLRECENCGFAALDYAWHEETV